MEQLLKEASGILRKGGVVAYPTDTVYGLGADAFNREAVERIYRIKQRAYDQPFSVLIAETSDLTRLASAVSDTARGLMERFWPGGLTLVLSKTPEVPLWVIAGGPTIAVRIPEHPMTLALIRSLGGPLIGTSANLSGRPSCTTAAEVRDQLGDSVDYILDGGRCPGGVESTVVDVTGEYPMILREGAVSREAIERFCRMMSWSLSDNPDAGQETG